MKKRVLAVLLAVCMIVGMGALAASAAEEWAKSGYAFKSDYSKIENDTTLSVLKKSTTGPVAITITPLKTSTTTKASVGGGKVTIDNATNFFSFDPKGSESYLQVSDSSFTEMADGKYTVKATFALSEGAADSFMYEVTGSITTDDKPIDKVNDNTLKQIGAYVLNTTAEVKTENVEVKEKLCSVTMGLRFNGDSSYTNLSASEIAEITATYNNVNGKEVTVHVNKINDLRENTDVTLKASLKPGVDDSEYGFSCWVDSQGVVIDESPEITRKIVADTSLYAVFTELKDRVRINYSAGEHGKIAYQEESSTNKVLTRGLLKSSDGQLSVMSGHAVTFVFTPDEGYQVAHVYVDKTGNGTKTDIASFGSLLKGGSVIAALRALVNATNKDVYQYTFTSADLSGFPSQIRSIEVEFMKVDPIEAPSGLDMPTVAAEGLTLATGAADENGSNAANGNGDSNGAATTVPAENGAAGNGGSAVSGVVNPATGSTGAVAVFAVLSVAAGAAFVTAKKKED